MSSSIELSIIVIVYKMRRQAYNTLQSLSATYQRNTGANYEVIVVENSSAENLTAAQIDSLPANFRYFLREEAGVSPVSAINFALQHCRGDMLGLIIDGARMLSPRVIEYVLALHRMFDFPLVAVPGYHLGMQQHDAAGEDRADTEQAELEELNWREDGYRLFNQACFSPGNRHGHFNPMMECNALFCTKQSFLSIGGADPRFNLSGGGSINLHIYRSLGMLPESKLIVLPGEGNFHQYHGGVTTKASDNRKEMLRAFNHQLSSFWGGQFKSLSREPLLFGTIGRSAQRFLQLSCAEGIVRFSHLANGNLPFWQDDISCSQ